MSESGARVPETSLKQIEIRLPEGYEEQLITLPNEADVAELNAAIDSPEVQEALDRCVDSCVLWADSELSQRSLSLPPNEAFAYLYKLATSWNEKRASLVEEGLQPLMPQINKWMAPFNEGNNPSSDQIKGIFADGVKPGFWYANAKAAPMVLLVRRWQRQLENKVAKKLLEQRSQQLSPEFCSEFEGHLDMAHQSVLAADRLSQFILQQGTLGSGMNNVLNEAYAEKLRTEVIGEGKYNHRAYVPVQLDDSEADSDYPTMQCAGENYVLLPTPVYLQRNEASYHSTFCEYLQSHAQGETAEADFFNAYLTFMQTDGSDADAYAACITEMEKTWVTYVKWAKANSKSVIITPPFEGVSMPPKRPCIQNIDSQVLIVDQAPHVLEEIPVEKIASGLQSLLEKAEVPEEKRAKILADYESRLRDVVELRVLGRFEAGIGNIIAQTAPDNSNAKVDGAVNLLDRYAYALRECPINLEHLKSADPFGSIFPDLMNALKSEGHPEEYVQFFVRIHELGHHIFHSVLNDANHQAEELKAHLSLVFWLKGFRDMEPAQKDAIRSALKVTFYTNMKHLQPFPSAVIDSYRGEVLEIATMTGLAFRAGLIKIHNEEATGDNPDWRRKLSFDFSDDNIERLIELGEELFVETIIKPMLIETEQAPSSPGFESFCRVSAKLLGGADAQLAATAQAASETLDGSAAGTKDLDKQMEQIIRFNQKKFVESGDA